MNYTKFASSRYSRPARITYPIKINVGIFSSKLFKLGNYLSEKTIQFTKILLWHMYSGISIIFALSINLYLKGLWHKIFDVWFFSSNCSCWSWGEGPCDKRNINVGARKRGKGSRSKWNVHVWFRKGGRGGEVMRQMKHSSLVLEKLS